MTDLRRAIMLLAASQMEVLPKEYAAVYCDLSEQTLEAAAKELRIDYSKQSSRLFFSRQSLDNFMLGRGAEPPQANKKRGYGFR